MTAVDPATFSFTGSTALDQYFVLTAQDGEAGTLRLICQHTGMIPPRASALLKGMRLVEMLASYEPPVAGRPITWLEFLLTAEPEHAVSRITATGFGRNYAWELFREFQTAVSVARFQQNQKDVPTDSDDLPQPDPDADLTLEFSIQLRIARRRGGERSYSQLAAITGVSKATIARAFTGKQLPSWGLTGLLLECFGVSREEAFGIWRRRWLLALEQRNPVGLHDTSDAFGEHSFAVKEHVDTTAERAEGPAPTPSQVDTTDEEPTGTPAGAPDGMVCESCGAWMVDVPRHQQWHRNLAKVGRRALRGAALPETSGDRPPSHPVP
ncbi:helix-turn-helix transcriptional regulator [Spirillospora sp. NPDC052269]